MIPVWVVMVVGGVGITLTLVTAAVMVARYAMREVRANAWDRGYMTRLYDDVSGLVSPNPFTDQEYPVVDVSEQLPT